MDFKNRKLGEPWDKHEPTVTMWLVRPEIDAIPLAIFAEKPWAEEWAHKYCRTAKIEAFGFVIRK